MSMPAGTITEFHACPMVTPGLVPIPHVGGPVMAPSAPTVIVGSMPIAGIGSMCVCVGPPDTVIATTAPTVLAGGKPVATITSNSAHGGLVASPSAPTVLFG